MNKFFLNINEIKCRSLPIIVRKYFYSPHLLDDNWRKCVMGKSSDPTKTPFMDISSNRKIIKLSELRKKLKNEALLEPFCSKKTIDFNLFEICEGEAKVILPGDEQQYDPDAKYDFFSNYNIAMLYERDINLIVMKTFIEDLKKKSPNFDGVNILETFSGTGIKTLRILKELDIGKIKNLVTNDEQSRYPDYMNLMLDINNLDTDEVKKILKVNCNSNSHILMGYEYDIFPKDKKIEKLKYHIINIDPYFNTTLFHDRAFLSLHDGGLISITFADGANTSGEKRNKSACLYESYRDRMGHNAHEHALRMIFYKIENNAAKHHKHIKPLFSFFSDFYAKVYFQVFDSKEQAEKSFTKFSKVFKCSLCPNIVTNPLAMIKKNEKNEEICVPSLVTEKISQCEICSGEMKISGPIWNQKLYDWEFTKKLISNFFDVKANSNVKSVFKNKLSLQSKLKIEAMLYGIIKEAVVSDKIYAFNPLEYIFFFDTIKKPNYVKILTVIESLGYCVQRSAIYPFSFKTNAPNQIITTVYRSWHKLIMENIDKTETIQPLSIIKSKTDKHEEKTIENLKPYETKNIGLKKVLGSYVFEKNIRFPSSLDLTLPKKQKTELELEIENLEKRFLLKKFMSYYTNPHKYWGPMKMSKSMKSYKRPESLQIPEDENKLEID